MSARLPQSPVSEKRVLARLILRGRREPGTGFLAVDDFENLYHQKLYEAYLNVSRRLPEFDEILILNEAKTLLKGNEQDQSNLESSFDVICTTIGTADLTEEIDNLKKFTKKRKLLAFSEEALLESKEESPNVGILIDKLAHLQAGGVKLRSFDTVVVDSLDLLRKRWLNGQEVVGLTTTIKEIDTATGGIMPGEISIIAGRPGSGKSTLLLQQAVTNAKLGRKILYFSLEMQEVELMEKIISRQAKIDSRLISYPESEATKSVILSTGEEIKQLPLTLVDNLNSIQEIVTACWFARETVGLDAVFIDYLQLIEPGKRNFMSDNSSVAYISRQLKMASQQLKVPFFVGCQLNRRADLREEQSPRLSDMRDSGAIEQDASVVMALHYQELTEDKINDKGFPVKDRTGGTAQVPTGKWATTGVCMLKNRRGKANFEVDINFEPAISNFSPMKKEEQPTLDVDPDEFGRQLLIAAETDPEYVD